MDDNTDNDPWFARARAYLARTSAESAWSAAVEARVEAQKTVMAVENAVDKAKDVVSATRSFLDVAEGIGDRGSAYDAWTDALTARAGFAYSLMAAEEAVDKAKHAVALTRRLRDSTLEVWNAIEPGRQTMVQHPNYERHGDGKGGDRCQCGGIYYWHATLKGGGCEDCPCPEFKAAR